MIIKFKWKDKQYIFKMQLQKHKLPTHSTVGITNRTKNGFFIPFIDYDEVKKTVVFEDIDFFQKHFNLSNAIVMKSSEFVDSSGTYGNYHVVFFDVLSFADLKEILENARCDKSFKQGWKWHNRTWVLRVQPKKSLKDGTESKPEPEFLKLCKGENIIQREVSKGHIQFYNKLFGLKIPIPDYHDDSTIADVKIITYGASL